MAKKSKISPVSRAPERNLTIGILFSRLTLPQLWAIIAALVALVASSFSVGVKISGFFASQAKIEELQYQNNFFASYLRYIINENPRLELANDTDRERQGEVAKNQFVGLIKDYLG